MHLIPSGLQNILEKLRKHELTLQVEKDFLLWIFNSTGYQVAMPHNDDFSGMNTISIDSWWRFVTARRVFLHSFKKVRIFSCLGTFQTNCLSIFTSDRWYKMTVRKNDKGFGQKNRCMQNICISSSICFTRQNR